MAVAYPAILRESTHPAHKVGIGIKTNRTTSTHRTRGAIDRAMGDTFVSPLRDDGILTLAETQRRMPRNVVPSEVPGRRGISRIQTWGMAFPQEPRRGRGPRIRA